MGRNGIIRCMDSLGRVVPPKEMRDRLGMQPGDPVEICMAEGHIEIYPGGTAPEACSCCGMASGGLRKHAGVALCGRCIQAFFEQEVKG